MATSSLHSSHCSRSITARVSREVDFESDAERARTTINRWVEQATKGKIADLVPSGIVTTLTRLVLVSAIAFKGSWAACFDEKDTTKECFFRLTDNFVHVPLMHRIGRYKLAAVDDAHVLELPYEGGAVAMVVILPDKKKGLPDVEAKLGAQLRAWLVCSIRSTAKRLARSR